MELYARHYIVSLYEFSIKLPNIETECVHSYGLEVCWLSSSRGPGFDPRSGQASWMEFLWEFSSPIRQTLETLGQNNPRTPFDL